MNTFLCIAVSLLIGGLLVIGAAFNNAGKWSLQTAVGTSQVGVIITMIGGCLTMIALAIKFAH